MVQLKGVEDFIYVLAAALILILVFAAISAIIPVGPGGVVGNISIAEFALGGVGYSGDYEASSISLGSFDVGEIQKENLRSAPQLSLSSSLLGSQKETFTINILSAYQDSLRDVVISFDVFETNGYGDLVVKWNGREFYRGRASPRDYNIIIEKASVKSSNTLEIYCDGPGLMFWASTVYTLRNFNADLEYGPSKIFAFTLSQGEIEAWDRGEVSFYGFGTGDKLTLEVNDVEIYEQAPSGPTTITFNYTSAPLRVGQNLLTFKTDTGVFTLQNAGFKIFLLTNLVAKQRSFELDSDQYGRLVDMGYAGRIEFSIESIERTGTLDIELNGKDLTVPALRTGWNSLTFTDTEAQAGTNTLEFSGNGFWDISEVKVRLEK